ncbi:hypothetical protein [Shinella zoogloeoides]|uniref:hypothetical protein n=1 Tax=Shinella zoogloeoides TaxID=352475 RepID=UPI000E65AFCB|nr:hypothetical protein [Shinella zoogloeoides]
MTIIVHDKPKLTRRHELEFEIAGLIEEAATSDEKVSPDGLASSILDLIEIETGVTFDGPPMSAT